jgi:hypothetical protein
MNQLDVSSEFADRPTPELWLLLSDEMASWAQKLARIARIAAELAKRGEDISHIRNGLGVYLLAIAEGSVLPELVVKYAGQRRILRVATALPVAEQQAIVENGRVPFVVRDGDGKYTTRMLLLSSMTWSQLGQVFGDRAIRSESEQIGLLTPPPYTPRKIVRRGTVIADRKNGVVRIGAAQAPIEDVIEALQVAGLIPV